MITLIIGGSGSGKSEFAEKFLIHQMNQNTKEVRYYLATMMPTKDMECEKRIARHRALRKDKDFITIEQPLDLEKSMDRMERGAGILLEDLSNLTANEMFLRKASDSKTESDTKRESDFSDEILIGLTDRIEAAVRELGEYASNLVIVSNTIFEDGVEYDEATTEYIRALGILNERISAFSDRVIEVVCGIPVSIKKSDTTSPSPCVID